MAKSGMLSAIDFYYSDSTNDDENDKDIWDDRKLNDAYDKALSIANAEVAKRVAMSTNSQRKSKQGQNEIKKEKPLNKTTSKSNKKGYGTQWKAGMPCRALYEVDGLEYEAFIMRIVNDKDCIVRFLGYQNSEICPINSLKPTLGKEERNRQIEQALDNKVDGAYTSQSPNTEQMDCVSDRVPSPGSTENSSIGNKKKSTKRKKHQKPTNSFDLPEMPFSMPNMSALPNFGSMEMPLPPPPIAMNGAGTDCEEQAISSMLLSWYMSGYYTGLYQGLKRAKENRRNV